MKTEPFGTVRVLIVDDDEDYFFLIRDLLAEIAETRYELDWAPDYQSAQDMIENRHYDAGLIDYYLGEQTGLDLMRDLTAQGIRIPLILLTGQGNHSLDMQAMNAGAADYLSKDEIDSTHLERSIRYAIGRKKAADRILHLAYFDSLTGLPNRVLFREKMKYSLSMARRHNRVMALLYIDLEDFRDLNILRGPVEGDSIMREVAGRLERSVRGSDIVSRNHLDEPGATISHMGGDEFTVLLSEIRNEEEIEQVVRRILTELQRPIQLEGNEESLSASIGISVFPRDGQEFDELLRKADTAMFNSRREGKNGYSFFVEGMSRRIPQ